MIDELNKFISSIKDNPEHTKTLKLADILLRHLKEEGVDEALECANTKYHVCPQHGVRTGFFYLCDVCRKEDENGNP